MKAIADTSVFIAREAGRLLEIELLPAELGVSMVTVGELRAGVLATNSAETRARRLETLTEALSFDPVPIGEPVATAWAELRIALGDAGRRMPVNDSWIAATAIALGLPVVTQDDDYDDVPGLDVIRV